MKISVVNHKDLDSVDGGTTRVRSIVQGLANHGHQVWYSCYGTSDRSTSRAGLAALRVKKPELKFLRQLARSLYGGEEGEAAIDILSCNHPVATLKLLSVLSSSNVMQIEQIWSALYPLLFARLRGKTAILDDHNVEVLLADRLSQYVSNKAMFRGWVRYVSVLERVCCMLADTIVVTSELDKHNLAKVQNVPERKIRVIPNGTDPRRYHPDPVSAANTREMLGISEEDPVLTFVGRSSYPPNRLAVDYIRNVLCHEVWKSHPRARFLIVSRELPEEFVQRADPRFSIISDSRDYPYINAADICLAPLTVGGGTRIKILNYMACAKPVVTTPVGIEGIPVKAGSHVAVASLENFADAVNTCLAGLDGFEEMGAKAREFVEHGYTWENSVGMFESLHSELVTRNGA
jgi:glycosyltransferase involved in cell wall biosynthesis